MTAAVPAGDREACVAELTREHFGVWVDVPSRGAAGYLYAIRDEYNDGYPSRHLVLVDEDGGAAEEEFTDSNPAAYPKTMQTPCLIRDERPAECAGQTALISVPDEAIVAALAEALRPATYGVNLTLPEIAREYLLPTVHRIAEQRAAEELLNAAREDGISTHKLTPVEVLTLRVVKLEALFDRAAALTATPHHGRSAT